MGEQFEWDENKRLINLAKHRLDFRDVDLVFDGRPVLTVRSRSDAEVRYLTIAFVEAEFRTAIWTQRGDFKRIISIRRSRDGEKRAYREVHGEGA